MNVSDISLLEAKTRCNFHTLNIAVGPFNFAISSPFKNVAETLYQLYGDCRLLDPDDIIDFNISVDKPTNIRRWFKPQVYFYLDGKSPFLPLPAAQAFPLLEWGMNWCIAQHTLDHLTLHAAVLERKGVCIILPAESGSGKSTLTAILANNGWRLFSDEMTLIRLKDLAIIPLARPISLKNKAIELIKNHYPEAEFSSIIDDTSKGTISHMRAPKNAVEHVHIQAKATAIIFPQYILAAAANLVPKDKGVAFMDVVDNSFNYELLAEDGFTALSKLIKQCDTYRFTYSSLQEAINMFEDIVNTYV